MNLGQIDYPELRLNEKWKLTNGEVKLALFGYHACRASITTAEFAAGVLADDELNDAAAPAGSGAPGRC